MHSQLAKAIFWAGARKRNPSLAEEYARVKESERLSRPQLEALQLERASRFLAFAEQHSPHWREVFAASGFSARRFSGLGDLARLPVIEKSELISCNAAIHTQYTFPKVFLAETSGTTGNALEFRKNERWDSTNRAYLMRGYDWYGVKPWERNGYLWGYDIKPAKARKVRLLDALQNRFRIFSYDEASVRAFAEELASAVYLGGYSSMVYEVARIINRLGLRQPQLRMVKGTSEMILDVYQAEAQKAFGTRIVSEYGAAEAGLIAFECPEGRMHVNMEDVILELDSNGDVLVTNLASWSFPIIRYRLGDQVKLSHEPCACGRAHSVVSEIMGRKGLSVVGRTGRYPALSFYYVFKNLALTQGVLLNYKALQEEAGRVRLDIEGTENQRHEPLVRGEIEKYFGSDIDFDIRWPQAFERERHKAQYFVSRLREGVSASAPAAPAPRA
jgi:phenylacetate-CoA ligase